MNLWRKRLSYRMRRRDIALLYASDVVEFLGFKRKALEMTQAALGRQLEYKPNQADV